MDGALHYLRYYDTNIYAYNILANYITSVILTPLIHALLYNTMLKKDLKKYETTYNTILMLLRTFIFYFILNSRLTKNVLT